jgi:small ubiquitin-related modifier
MRRFVSRARPVVVYHPSQSLPQYAIWYKHTPACKCTHCWLNSSIKVTVSCAWAGGASVAISIRRSSKLQALFAQAKLVLGLGGSVYKFMYQSTELTGDETANDLNMEDGVSISVLQQAESDSMNFRVVTQDGNEIFFKCKSRTPLKKLMIAFCNRKGVAVSSVRFLYHGDQIQPHQTPADLDMEDGDVIDVSINSTHAAAHQLTLQVMSPTGVASFFRCKPTTPLQNLMDAWCKREGVPPDSVRFLFDGQRIRPNHTPDDLDMKDLDVIDVSN